jgi:hypothetical protein
MIMVTVSAVAIFAFAVLAIDGAILMATRTQLHNAADAGRTTMRFRTPISRSSSTPPTSASRSLTSSASRRIAPRPRATRYAAFSRVSSTRPAPTARI